MELYVFNQHRALIGIVESFEYLRWTRRYSQCGSFELKANASTENAALLQVGNYIWKNDDEEIGLIEFQQLSQTDSEIIIVSGRFATILLGRRIIWNTERLNGDLSACIGQLINNNVISPSDPDRQITDISFSSPNLDIPVKQQVSYTNLLDKIQELCTATSVGIKTIFSPESGHLTVTLYMGTSSQAVFSKEYDNLLDQTLTKNTATYANTAKIGGEGEGENGRIFEYIYNGAGEERREVFVDAKDLRVADFPTDYDEALILRGLARLSEFSMSHSFDVIVNNHSNLTYKTDYDLGQVVQVISKKWGVTMTARIEEVEESYDAEGQSINVTFGKAELTIAQKLKSEFSQVRTSLGAPTGLTEMLGESNEWTDLQKFSGGVMISSARLAANTSTAGGNDPTLAKYYHVARVVINGSFNRIAFKFDYIGTGTTPKMGTIEGYVYSTSSFSTISIQSFVQAYTRDKSPFLPTDIKVVKSASSTKTIWDIYVWLSDYGTAYVNGLYALTESGNLLADPRNGDLLLVANLPIVSSTFTYEGENFTVTAIDNGVVRTSTYSEKGEFNSIQLPNRDISLTSSDNPLQIGVSGGVNMVFGGNEIMTRNNGLSSPMYLNLEGGPVCVNGDATTGIIYGGDTGWQFVQDAEFQNGFTAYIGGTAQRPRYRRVGRVVHLFGACSPPTGATINSASATSMFTLPVGFRPNYDFRTLCQGSSTNKWLFVVGENGQCTAARYGTNEYASNITGNEWLPFNVCFLADPS
ncbi:siphovirus ReqiPepy6 Gp37-like family protein [Mobilitalea sibirica]|uniref:Siphovirus ReqiPepy6 Gp37-like family protein n=1 Tax=Mobilitalea sibirica TaxID=1462919 RepID=A0A8J7H335_9FIRM|nr:siphovirus ReqiPepy6 Gp37-like family protein [Mobilitalea sibirica]MBH1941327.1 siphovirus ReqiPepy6 Gp37-like family protein [Mobilitalea sibirica]